MKALGYRAHAMERGRGGRAVDRAPADTLVSVVLVPG